MKSKKKPPTSLISDSAERVQLQHPEGKKAITMDAGKYQTISAFILKLLQKRPLPHREILAQTTAYIHLHHPDFVGAPAWHAEWVKLDLEAKSIIRRFKNEGKVLYQCL